MLSDGICGDVTYQTLCDAPQSAVQRLGIYYEISQVLKHNRLLPRFMGTFGSTFSAHISRLRAYHSSALVPDKGVYFMNYPRVQVRCWHCMDHDPYRDAGPDPDPGPIRQR